MYPIHQAMRRGVLLPLKMYFQPGRVRGELPLYDGKGHPGLYALVSYLFAVSWVPAGVLLGVLIFGPPRMHTPGIPAAWHLPLLLVLCGSAVLLGATMGYGYRFVDGRWSGYAFNHNLAASFGVILSLMAFFSTAWQRSAATGFADGPVSDPWDSIILGAGAGLLIGVIFGYRFGARAVVLFGLPLGILVIAFFGIASQPHVRAANLAFSAILVILLTHILWQPLYFGLGLVTHWLALKRPAWSRCLWRISPANWCEFCYVPLPGLSHLLLALCQVDPAEGKRALEQVEQHPFLRNIGKRVATTVMMDWYYG